MHLGVINLQVKMVSSKTLKGKLQRIQVVNTEGEDRETCTKEHAQTEWEHCPVRTVFTHIG